MTSSVHGIHHVTCIAGDAQENLDFYAAVLGLRLVKRSVNQDDPGSLYMLGSGNMQKSRVFLQENGYVPKMLAKSRFHRRQYQIAELFLMVFELQNTSVRQS